MLNQLIFNLTDLNVITYFLMNGFYLGLMGDYSNCHAMTLDGKYFLATITSNGMVDSGL